MNNNGTFNLFLHVSYLCTPPWHTRLGERKLTPEDTRFDARAIFFLLIFFFFSKQGLGVFFSFASLVFVYAKKTKPNASKNGPRKCRRFEAQATVPFFLGFVFWMIN